MDWGKNSKGGGMITIDELALEIGLTKASLVSRIKNFYKRVWHASCGKRGNRYINKFFGEERWEFQRLS